MVSFRWRRWLEKTFGTKTRMPYRRREVRPRIEVLEDRWVPAFTSTTAVTITPSEGSSFSGTVATFTTNTPGDTFTASINWGDGTTTMGTVTQSGGNGTVSGTHTYADEGTQNVTVSLTETGSSPATATVNSTANVAEADSLTGNPVDVQAPESVTVAVQGSFIDTNLSANANDFTATIDFGDGTTGTGTVQATSAAGVFNVFAAHVYDEGTFHTHITVTDDSPGTATVTMQTTMTIAEGDSLSGSGSTITPTEGTGFSGTVATFTDTNTFALASDFTASINWGDGTTTTGTVSGSTGGPFTVTGGHTYADEGTFTTHVTLTDDSPGTATATANGTANVAEADALSISSQVVIISEPEPAAFNSASIPTGLFAFTDTNTSNVASDFTATIDWGDGTTTTGTVSFVTSSGSSTAYRVDASHTYADEGSFTITATVADDSPGTASASITAIPVTVAESDSLSGTASTISSSEGQSFSGTVATFTDTNTTNVAGDFTATIDWGDGNTTTGTVSGSAGNFTVTGSHTYVEEGPYTTHVTLTDDAPGTATATANGSASVADQPITNLFLASPGFTATEGVSIGGPFTGVATFTDPAGVGVETAAGDFTASIAWGDGSTSTATVVSDGGGNYHVNIPDHTYADEGNFNLSITVTHDLLPPVTSNMQVLTVNDTDSLSGTASTITPSEGQFFSGTVATFTDTNTTNVASDFTATIDWGDGTTDTGSAVTITGSAGNFTVTGSHTYVEEGPYTTHVTLTDDAPGTATATANGSATVADQQITGLSLAAPGFTATEGVSIGGPFTDVATFTDPAGQGVETTADFTASISWGDGTTSTATVVSDGSGNYHINIPDHIYADEGNFNLSVTVKHDLLPVVTSNTQVLTVNDTDSLAGTGATISQTEGTGFSGTVATFTDTNTTNVAGDFTASIDWGDGTTTTGTVSGSAGNFTVSGSHTYLEDGTFTTHVTLSDDSPGTATATANGTAHIAEAGIFLSVTPISPTEGTAFSGQVATFTDPGSPDPSTNFTASIDWGDGTTTGGTVTGSAGNYTVAGSHIYADEGSFNPVITVSEHGVAGSAFSATSRATVAEADSLSGTGSTITPTEGTSFSGTVATFTDTNTANVVGDFTATIDWGDGTTNTGKITISGSAGNFTVTGSHTYADEGSFTTHVTLTDNAPGTATATATGTANVAEGDSLSVATATSLTRTEGQPFSGQVATFTDTNTGNVAGDFSATIVWGDGATSVGSVSGSAGSFTVFGNHTYTEDGSFTISTTLTDDTPGTATVTATATATISEATLTATANNISTTEGTAFSGTVGTFTDPGSLDAGTAFTATIAWGDGTSSAGTITGAAGNYTIAGSHTYAEEGSFTVTLTAFENNSPTVTATASSTATVAEAGLTLTTNAISVTEGQTFSGPVATLSDPGSPDPASSFSATINWGDGTSSAGTITGSAGNYTVSGSHTFAADEGTFTVSVSASEPGVTGANSASGTLTATVLEGDVLTASGLTFKATAGASFSRTVATFTDTNTTNVAADFSATIDWGDGSTTTGTVSGGNGSFTVSGSHTYSNFGNFTVTVRIADDAPGTATATATAQATVKAPPISQKLQQQLIIDLLLQPLLHTDQGLSTFEFEFAALFGQSAMTSGFSAAQQLVQNEISLIFDLELQLLEGFLGQHDSSLQTKINDLAFNITTDPLYNTALGYDLGLYTGALTMRFSVPS